MPGRLVKIGAVGAAALAAAASALAGSNGHARAHPPPPATCHVRGHGLLVQPDPRCTPGATDARVTQADITRTICRAGYTRRVRPPESVTEPEKRAAVAAYGYYAGHRLSAYEYDHLIPLELGGAPNDPHNLWPEAGATPNPKDRLENVLRRDVCRGHLPLSVARREIATGWVAADRRLIRSR